MSDGGEQRESGSTAADCATALVVSGGGARGAYQVGVLKGLVEIGVIGAERPGFQILAGSSAGSLNAAMLAAHADDVPKGVRALERVWSEIEIHQVFRTDVRSLGGIGFQWVWDLSFGGMLRRVAPKALLDTAPLRKLLKDRIPFKRIEANVEAGLLRALSIAATELYTSNGVLFVSARPEVPLWSRSRWSIERTSIGVEHLMASSAIPVFFPSIAIDGRHYGDGCIRNTTPLSPAINLGADRIVAIGVLAPATSAERPRHKEPPTIAHIAGTLLDAVMLDAIEVDVEHSERVNTSVLARPTGSSRSPFRWIDVLWLSPRQNLGQIAAALAHRIPGVVHYLMRGLGSDEATIELASYLLFDGEFCRRLITLGHEDVKANREEIERFFARPPRGTAAPAGAER